MEREKIIGAFNYLNAHTLMNLYAAENVVFGYIHANEAIPITKYFDDLGLQQIESFFKINYLDGRVIENGCIKDRDFNELCFELYCDKIDCVFCDVPIDKSYDDYDEDLFHYKFGLYDYLKDTYQLFKDIIKTETSTSSFTGTLEISNEIENKIYYMEISKFILAINLEGLQQDRKIDKYIKNLPFISPMVMRLVKKYKGHYYLENNDIHSLDYKLALFSCFRYFNKYNAKLFEQKTLKWEENHQNIK